MTHVEQQVADWWAVAELAIAMAEATPGLARLGGITSDLDGYGSGSTARGGPGTIANPTLATVVKAAGGKVRGDIVAGEEVEQDTPDTWSLGADRIATLLDVIESNRAQLLASARRIASAKRLVDGRADSRIGRQSSLQKDCLCCEKPVTGVGNDKLKSGYCPPCKQAWLRFQISEHAASRVADHEVFRRQRRAALAKKTERAS